MWIHAKIVWYAIAAKVLSTQQDSTLLPQATPPHQSHEQAPYQLHKHVRPVTTL